VRIGVIGGGAAGFFAAISAKEHHPHATVTLLEKTSKTLGKVKVSGGGRCNVTHDCNYVSDLVKHYPRGGKKLKKTFKQFDHKDTLQWFESRGVKLKVEDDGRIFPVTDDSQTIIDILWKEVNRLGITVSLSTEVSSLSQINEGKWQITIKKTKQTESYDAIIVTTGGHPKRSGYDWLVSTGHLIISPVPSLFTFNMPVEPIKALMGVVSIAEVSIIGTRYKDDGPLLITHWGMSGPAILKLSAWAARDLANLDYQYSIAVAWVPGETQESIKTSLNQEDKKKLKNNNPFGLPARLWAFLIDRAEADKDKPWSATSKKTKNKLSYILSHDIYKVSGKTTFKEEFVTCGGVSLSQIDMMNMGSTECNNLYFAGEVLDIDAVTGGFNFQAAWSTGFVAGKLG